MYAHFLVVAGDNYLLLPQQQRWIWSHFLRNGESLRETKERHDSLPDWSLVLNGDSRGQVQVQVSNGEYGDETAATYCTIFSE